MPSVPSLTVPSDAVARAAEVLCARPAALITDLDGTLSPLAATPEEAFPLPGSRIALRALAHRLDVVAVLSGRPASEVRRLVGLRRLVYLGNHGLERWEAGRQSGRAASRVWRAALTKSMASVRRELATLPGLRIEDKGVSFSIHYRAAPNHGAARSTVLSAAQRAADPFRLSVREGKKVVEVGPPEWPGKGEAVADLVRQFGLKSVAYLGDDESDLEVFQRLASMRGRRLRALAVAVEGPEAPAELAEAADVRLAGPTQAVDFLAGLAAALTVADDGGTGGGGM